MKSAFDFYYLSEARELAWDKRRKIKSFLAVTAARVEDGAVTVLHLAPGYTTSVRLPEEISSVVIGNPASFKAEHSEAEPRLVFFKPTTSQNLIFFYLFAFYEK